MKKVMTIFFMVSFSATVMAQKNNGVTNDNQKVILIFRFKTDVPQPTAEQMKASGEKWGQWMGGLAQQGKLAGGEQVAFGGTTISGTKKEITYSPVIANKELVTGYMVINVKDLKEAETIAQDCPILAFNGSVEIRQLQMQNN